MNPPDKERLTVQTRPLSDAELSSLRRQAADAESTELLAQARYRRRIAIRAGALLVIYTALWIATYRLGLEVTKSIVSTAAGVGLALGLGVWEWHADRRRLARIRAGWAESIGEARRQLVGQIDVAPVRAWKCHYGSGGRRDVLAWLFDLGGGWALFVEWDLPEGQPRERIVWSCAAGGFTWIDQSGKLIAVSEIVLDWNWFPSDHPLAQSWWPALFRLGEQEPAAALLAFEEGSFPLGTGQEAQ